MAMSCFAALSSDSIDCFTAPRVVSSQKRSSAVSGVGSIGGGLLLMLFTSAINRVRRWNFFHPHGVFVCADLAVRYDASRFWHIGRHDTSVWRLVPIECVGCFNEFGINTLD